MRRSYAAFTLFAFGLLALFGAPATTWAIECAFSNPLVPIGFDPSVVYHDGIYYRLQSANGSRTITLAQSDTITGLSRADPQIIFTPPANTSYSYDLWAPELVRLDDNWYIYVAGTDAPGHNPSHRLHVLKADTDDPFGSWTMLGQIHDPAGDFWQIDASVFDYEGARYMVWSGWPGARGDFPQNLYIAEMSSPTTLATPRSLIGEPDQPWEQTVAAINEGPQPFLHDGALSIVYSADASWTSAYKLGLLELTGDDPLDRTSWTEVGPVLEGSADGETPIYAPGHNSSPIPSPDGSENWFLYHANLEPDSGWDGRSIHAAEFAWSDEGYPIFTPPRIVEPLPAGEPCGQIASFETVALPTPAPNATPAVFVDTGDALINTRGSFSVAARVILDQLDGTYAFVSQDGGLTSNFVLGYEDGAFTFTLFESMGQSGVTIRSSEVPQAGESYALVGVYDAVTGTLRLYVDGALQGEAEFTGTWAALGDTILGAARERSQRVDIFSGDAGALSDVELFNGALDAAEIGDMAQVQG